MATYSTNFLKQNHCFVLIFLFNFSEIENSAVVAKVLSNNSGIHGFSHSPNICTLCDYNGSLTVIDMGDTIMNEK